MDVNTKENTSMTRSRDTECSNGPMVVSTMDSGKTESNMDKDLTFLAEVKPSSETGLKASASTGSKTEKRHECFYLSLSYIRA